MTDTPNSVSGSPKRKYQSRWYDYEFQCRHCHQRFNASRQDAKYCSPECRTRHWKEQRRKPEYLLKDNPQMLANYQVIAEISPGAAEVCAKVLRGISPEWGCDVIMACVWSALSANPQLRNTFQAARDRIQPIKTNQFRAADNGILESEAQ